MSELRPHSRELLEAARIERTPGRADRERVFRALTAGAALSGAATSAAATPSVFAKLSTGVAKWWLLGGLCTALVGGTYLARRHERAVTSATQAMASVTPKPAISPRIAAPSPAPSAMAAPTEMQDPVAPPAAIHGTAKPTSVHDTLEQELTQLHAAETAYRAGQAQRALSLIAEHERRFPRSQLGGERAVLEVLALCQVGKTARARALADRLRSSARGSAAVTGLETSCAATAK